MAVLPFCLQPGVCHPAVLCTVPTEEVSANLPHLFLTQEVDFSLSHFLTPPPLLLKMLHHKHKESFQPFFTSAAPYQSAAWNQNCRRKSGPATQGWSGSTSTKGFERPGPSPQPNTLPPHGHRRGPRCQPSSLIQCAKVKFVSPPLPPPPLQRSGPVPPTGWRSC